MKKKIFKFGLVFIIAIGIIGINFTTINAKPPNIYNDPEYWALFFVPIPGYAKWGEDLTIIQEVLLENGWEEDHFIELIGEDATKYKLLNVKLPELDAKEDWDDTTLIFIFSHGSDDGYFYDCDYPWGPTITYSDLNAKINDLESEGIGIIINTCYSGCAIDYLKKDGRVIVTSTNAEKQSQPGFGKYFAYGLDVFGDWGVYGNQNGVSSLEEAYDLTKNEIWSYFDPLYWDGYPTYNDREESELHITFQNWEDGHVDEMSNRVFRKWSGGGSLPVKKYGSVDKAAAQNFTLKSPYLTKVRINVKKNPNPQHPLKVSIRDELNSLVGIDLVSNYIYSADIDNYAEYYTVDFGEGLQKEQDYYFIVCRQTDPEQSNIPCYSICMEQDQYGRNQCAHYWDNPGPWEAYDNENWDIYFVTYGKGENQPPYVPKRPVSSVIGIEGSYVVRTEDVDGDDIRYEIDWGDGSPTEWSDWAPSGDRVFFFHQYSSGTYYVKVRAKDDNDNISDWSDVLTVDI